MKRNKKSNKESNKYQERISYLEQVNYEQNQKIKKMESELHENSIKKS